MSETGPVRIEVEDSAPWLMGVVLLASAGAVWLRVVGLSGADLHGPLHRMGIMDPFCGGTRATYLLGRGDLVGAWSWNPMVPLLALGASGLVVRFLVGRFSGRWVDLHLPRRTWVALLAAAFVVLEVNQQLQAERLINVVPA